MIEQAIFASARTASMAGYQLTAATDGVSEADARQIIRWSPSHDALLCNARRSLNFFLIDQSRYCISRTSISEDDYSNRGACLRTHCLVFSNEDLQKSAGNPLRIWRRAQWKMDAGNLQPLRSIRTSRPIQENLVYDETVKRGAATLVLLVDAIMQHQAIACVAVSELENLLAVAIDLLPLTERSRVSFSTNLKHSRQRPFQIVQVDSPAMARRLRNYVPFFEQPNGEVELKTEWARFVAENLATSNIRKLSRAISEKDDLIASR